MEKDNFEHNEDYMPGTGTAKDNPSPAKYLATRFSTLKPPMNKVANPISLLRMLNKQQWLFFAIAFAAWSWDAFDFFTVRLVDMEQTWLFMIADVSCRSL